MSDDVVTRMIFSLLDARAAAATICPSEVARALHEAHDDGWRALLPEVRRVAAALARAGRLRVTRRGSVVDAEAPRGPIRLGRP